MNAATTIRFIREFKPASALRIWNLVQPPILIAGCGRSGTSLLLAILDAHPKVQGIPYESNIFNQPKRWSANWINHANDKRKISDILLRIPLKPTADRWCEKTPSNVRYLPDLLQKFGEKVRIIHIIRDGRDVVTSVHPTKKGVYWVKPERWVSDVTLGLAYEDHPQFYTIKYEDLIADYEPTVTKLLHWLGLEMDPAVMDYHQQTSVKTINAWNDGVKPIYTSSVQKWRLPEHAEVVRRLIDSQRPYDLLNKLGYGDELPTE